MLKKSVIIFYFLIFNFLGFMTILPNVYAFSENKEFVCQIVSDNPNLALNNIKVDVYKSTPVYDETLKEITHYNEESVLEVISNETGELIFNKPSDSFSITVDLQTLPYSYGIDTKTMFISKDINYIEFRLFKVSEVDFIRKDNKINISVLNEIGQAIYANYETSVQHLTPFTDINAMKEFHSLITVTIYDKVYEYNNIICLSNYNYLDKVEFLFNLNLLTEEEKAQLLAEYYLNEINNGPSISFVRAEKRNVYDDEQKGTIVPLSTIWTNYQSAGRFKVHYTSGEDEDVAQYIANIFVQVEYYFHDTLGYKVATPSNILASSYHVYLVRDLINDEGAIGITYCYTNGSYIDLDYVYCRDTFNADSDPTDNAYNQVHAVIAHEYFHAIMNEYKFNCDDWIAESFATWASAIFLEDNNITSAYKSTLENRARMFITSGQILTSTNDSDEYRAYIFIYYLFYKFGYQLIKDIVVDLDSTRLEQIKEKLNAYTDESFETLFEEFSVWNAYPNNHYDGFFDNLHPSYYMERITLNNRTVNFELSNLSSKYLVYNKQSCDGYDVNITIKTNNNANLKINVVREKNINGVISYSYNNYDGSSYTSITIPLEITNYNQSIIIFTNISSTDLINLEYTISYSHPTKRIYTGTTELKRHNHDTTMGYSFLPVYKGLYQIKVPSVTTSSDIMIVDNDPNIYSDYNIIKKIKNNSYYQNSASNISSSDNFIVYLDNYIEYFILLKFRSASLNITITYLNSYETLNSNGEYINTKNAEKGDYLKQLLFMQSGKYEFELQYNNLPSLNYALLKTDANNNVTVLGLSKINSTSSNTKFILDISEGTKICFGYLDNYTNFTVTLKVARIVDSYIRLIPDPNYSDRSLLGSEVNIRNGSVESNLMTVGYTRNVYIDPNEANISRLSYNWYSTDSNIARVSSYGTITGISCGVVTIRAVLKSNPAVVGELQITVFDDTSTEARLVKLTTDLRESSPYTGSEVSSGKGIPGEKTIHIGYTRLLCFDNSDPTQLSPSFSIQDYNWVSSNSSIASVSSYGTITANGAGVVEIIGYYKYNSNFTAKIEITVVLN